MLIALKFDISSSVLLCALIFLKLVFEITPHINLLQVFFDADA